MNIYVGNLSFDTTEEQLRQAFSGFGEVTSINIISAPGAGKTSLLEQTIPHLPCRVGVLEGDIATTRDADRIAKLLAELEAVRRAGQVG